MSASQSCLIADSSSSDRNCNVQVSQCGSRRGKIMSTELNASHVSQLYFGCVNFNREVLVQISQWNLLFLCLFSQPPPSPKKPKNPLQNKIRNQAQEEKALLTLCRTTICVIFGITCRHLYVLQFALSERWWNPRTWQAVACFTGS